MSGEDLAALVSEAVALFLMILFAAAGNGIVLTLVWKDRRMHTPRNILLTSSAVADMILSCVAMPPNFISLSVRRWVFGDIVCHATALLSLVLAKVTILTIASVVFEKLQFLRTKQFPYLSREVLAGIVVMVWSVPTLFAVVYIFLLADAPHLDAASPHRCSFVSLDPSRFHAVALIAVEASLFVVMPLLLIALCFWQMSRNCLSAGASLKMPEIDVERTRRAKIRCERRRSVRSLLLFSGVTLMFVFPFQFAGLAHISFLDQGRGGIPVSAQKATLWLFWGQCVLKPMIYLFNNERSYRFLKKQRQRLAALCSRPQVHHLDVQFRHDSDDWTADVVQADRSWTSRAKYEHDNNRQDGGEGEDRERLGTCSSLRPARRYGATDKRSPKASRPCLLDQHAWELRSTSRPSFSSFQFEFSQ